MVVKKFYFYGNDTFLSTFVSSFFIYKHFHIFIVVGKCEICNSKYYLFIFFFSFSFVFIGCKNVRGFSLSKVLLDFSNKVKF